MPVILSHMPVRRDGNVKQVRKDDKDEEEEEEDGGEKKGGEEKEGGGNDSDGSLDIDLG